jgi:hypothetical protein
MHPLIFKAGVGALKLGAKKWTEANEERKRQGRPSLEDELATSATRVVKRASKSVRKTFR